MARRAAALVALILAAGTCAAGASGQEPARVFAAASIADAVERVLADAGSDARVNAAASSTLAQQIAQGAPADVFVSAHRRWLDYLSEQDLLVGGTRAWLCGNELVWVSADPAWIGQAGRDPRRPLAHLDRVQRIAMGDPDHVPAGQYARAALRELGVWDDLAPRVVPAIDVRAALQLVERGETELGIVYRTDAAMATRAVIVDGFSATAAPQVSYQIAMVRGGGDAAHDVLALLSTDASRRVFAELGFLTEAAAAELPSTGIAVEPPRRGLLTGGEWSALWLSLQVGLLATAAALPCAIALAYWLARSRSRWRVLIDALVVLPMVLPPVVVGYFLLVLFGRQGILPTGLPFTWGAAALAALVMGFPLMVRALRQAFENVDPALEQAAATLGSGRLRVFLTVTLPLSARGLWAGASLCFARSLGEFGATITFAGNLQDETRTLPLAIWTALQTPGREGSAWRLTIVCVVVSLSASVLSEGLLSRERRRARGEAAA